MCPCDHHTNSMGLHTCSHLSPKSSWWWFPITAGLYHNLLNQALVEGHLGFPLPLLQLKNNAEMTAMLSHFSRVRLCATPWTAAHQAPPSLGFSRQEHWSGLPFPSPVHESEKWKWSRSVVSDSQRPHGLQPSRLLCPWDFPGKSTGVGCHCLLQLRWLCRYKCPLTYGAVRNFILYSILGRYIIYFVNSLLKII